MTDEAAALQSQLLLDQLKKRYRTAERESTGKLAYPLIESAATIEGLPHMVGQLMAAVPEKSTKGPFGMPMPPGMITNAGRFVTEHTGSPEWWSREIQEATGVPSIRSESAPGRIAQDVATAGTTALATGGGAPLSLLAGAGGGVSGGLREAGAPPEVQFAAGILIPIIGAKAFGAMVQTMPSKMLAESIRGATPQQLAGAGKIMLESGNRVLLPEALNQVTGGAFPKALGLQRFVENAPTGSNSLAKLMSARAGENEKLIQGLLERPSGDAAVAVPKAFKKAAYDTETGVRQAINKASDASYAAAETAKIPAAEMVKITAHPAWEGSLKAVRSDPLSYGDLRGFSDDSVKVLDAVKKYADKVERAARKSGDFPEAANTGRFGGEVREAAVAASPDYARALQIQQAGRQNILEPVKTGPIGQIARGQENLSSQLGQLIPLGRAKTVTPRDVDVLREHLKMIGRKDPAALKNFVNESIGDAFDYVGQGASELMKQGQGAAFVKYLNGPNGDMLKTLIENSSVNGPAKWQAFKRASEILEATGYRLPTNSPTTFNAMIEQNISRPGIIPLSPADLNLLSRNSVWNSWTDWMRGAGRTEKLIELIRDPKYQSKWTVLAATRPGTPAEKQALFALLGVSAADQAGAR
jgi:hypothetical protein